MSFEPGRVALEGVDAEPVRLGARGQAGAQQRSSAAKSSPAISILLHRLIRLRENIWLAGVAASCSPPRSCRRRFGRAPPPARFASTAFPPLDWRQCTGEV